MTVAELMAVVNKDLEFYEIVPSLNVLGEEGKLVESDHVVGYAVVNKITAVIEHTSTILPGVLFQAQHFDNTLRSLTEAPEETLEGESSSQDDVVLN